MAEKEKKSFTLPTMKIGSISSGQAPARKAEVAQNLKEIKKTSFNLPLDLYRDLKQLAVAEDKTLGDLVEEALQDVIRKYGN